MVRVFWRQNGHATSKTEQVRIEAGEMHTLYLNPAEVKSRIAANLKR